MSSPSDAGLPRELDFAADPEASSARMNRAMAYIVAGLRAANAQRLDYQDAIEELRRVGLARLADALTPVLVQAQTEGNAIAAIYAQLVAGGALEALKADILAELDVRLDADEAAIAANVAAIAVNVAAIAGHTTALAAAEADRWFHSHG